jgi:hypothetical protein
MVGLAPACLHFAGEMRPHIPDLLKGESMALNGVVRNLFIVTAAAMEKEIEDRLHAAESEIGRNFPDTPYARLARRAPEDIIRMFNGSQKI